MIYNLYIKSLIIFKRSNKHHNISFLVPPLEGGGLLICVLYVACLKNPPLPHVNISDTYFVFRMEPSAEPVP